MIFIGIGSNLESNFGDRFTNIDLAIKYLENENLKVVKKSSYYETPSYPDIKKPKFINVVISINTDITLKDLVAITVKIEEKLERKRNTKNDPRTCDIDIIDFNKKILERSFKNFNFQVPHKSMKYRNFVLYPLHEIDPHWKHPETKEDINNLIEKLDLKHKKSILKMQKS